MADIRHRVGINAPPQRVYDALATRDGLAEWWTRDVRGDESVGGELQFYFGRPDPSAVMEVVKLEPDSAVGWRVVSSGAEEWVGTDISFDLAYDGEETVVLFTHANWREPVPFMHHCSSRWAYFLFGLKDGIEDGEWAPFPDDRKLSKWD